ncbi:MAG: DUF1761 domain-containing protein [Croceibacterium sp.]
MGSINIVAVLLAAVAFFVLGALWYGPLFGRPWRELNGITVERMEAGPQPGQNPMWLIMALAFAFELLVAVMLGHLIARTAPKPWVIMMMAAGLGATVMTPALGINYLFQMRPGKLFAIDAGYMICGMALMGAVFIALG